jgi:hypothetical protein
MPTHNDFTDRESAKQWLEDGTREQLRVAPMGGGMPPPATRVRPQPEFGSPQPMQRRPQPEFGRIRQQMRGLSPEAQYQVESLQEPLRSPLEEQALMQEYDLLMQKMIERRVREDALRAQYEEPMDIGPWPAAGISGRRRRMTRVY